MRGDCRHLIHKRHKPISLRVAPELLMSMNRCASFSVAPQGLLVPLLADSPALARDVRRDQHTVVSDGVLWHETKEKMNTSPAAESKCLPVLGALHDREVSTSAVSRVADCRTTVDRDQIISTDLFAPLPHAFIVRRPLEDVAFSTLEKGHP